MIEQKYLDKINFPSDLKKLKTTELKHGEMIVQMILLLLET